MLIEDLKALVAVAELGSFSKAATQLRVAQSSLSKRVARLEARFGTLLLIRHGRGVQTTPAGQALLARSSRLLAELRDIERDVSTLVSEPAGEVRLALPPATSTLLSPLILRECAQRFPRIRPRILEGTSANSHVLLATGQVDLALTYNPDPGPDCDVQPVLAEPLYLIRKASRRPAPQKYRLEDLANLPLLLPARPHSIRVLVERLCAGRGVQPHVRYEIDGVNTLASLVDQDLGVTIFSRLGFQQALDAGRMVAAPFTTPLMNWKLCLAWARRSERFVPTQAIRELIARQLALVVERGQWPHARLLPPEPGPPYKGTVAAS